MNEHGITPEWLSGVLGGGPPAPPLSVPANPADRSPRDWFLLGWASAAGLNNPDHRDLERIWPTSSSQPTLSPYLDLELRS